MNDGIDYKKIESCMVEIYGLPDFTFDTSFYNETLKILLLCNKIRYVTASGIPIRSLEGGKEHIDADNTHLGIIRKSLSHSNGYGRTTEKTFREITTGDTSNNFMKNTKMCRVNWISWSVNSLNEIIREKKHGELDIETYYSLTDLQRRVILDIIKVSGVSPDRVYIDDHSEEQCVKRQLRLHSVVSQFHR